MDVHAKPDWITIHLVPLMGVRCITTMFVLRKSRELISPTSCITYNMYPSHGGDRGVQTRHVRLAYEEKQFYYFPGGGISLLQSENFLLIHHISNLSGDLLRPGPGAILLARIRYVIVIGYQRHHSMNLAEIRPARILSCLTESV